MSKSPMRLYYFGCIKGEGRGHCFHRPGLPPDPGLYPDLDADSVVPWGTRSNWRIDGGLCPVDRMEAQGRAKLHHEDGWTAISFWDRTGDPRGKSNSAFVAEGEFEFDEMVNMAKAQFPEIFRRFTFPIVLAAEINAAARPEE